MLSGNKRALGWNKTPPKMCSGQHLLASVNTTGGEQASLEEKEPAGVGLCETLPYPISTQKTTSYHYIKHVFLSHLGLMPALQDENLYSILQM